MFALCDKLKKINIDKKNANYKSVDGVVYSKDGETLIYCPGKGKTGEIYNYEDVTKYLLNCSRDSRDYCNNNLNV